MAAHERLIAEREALVKDLPELVQRAAGGERHIDQIDGHDALIEAAVILGLARLIIAGVCDVVPACAGAVGRQEAAAAHAGVHVAMARRFTL